MTSSSTMMTLELSFAAMTFRQTIDDFPKFDHSSDETITLTVTSNRQVTPLRNMTSRQGDLISDSVDSFPFCQPSQCSNSSPFLCRMKVRDNLKSLSSEHLCKVTRISPSLGPYKQSLDSSISRAYFILFLGHTVRDRSA